LKKPYNEEFPEGTLVRIVDAERLVEFQRTWRYHNPLTDEQMAYALHAAQVKSVSFYHGGDVLYDLDGVPGIWHECLLGRA
jgi:hypothetical protein